MTAITELQINKQALNQCRQKTYQSDSLKSDEVLLRVEHFAFTANNITYGVTGESFSYWQFFPTDEGFGLIPVWGFATVEESAHPEFHVGARIYGYFPMASHMIMKAQKQNGNAVLNVSQHRLRLPAVYNIYIPCDSDPLYSKETEAFQMLYRPLFTTAFLLADMIGGSKLFGAKNVLLTSGSSKTASATAAMLKQLDCVSGEIIGLTSASNHAFTEQLGCYDRVVCYDDIAELDSSCSCVIVDMAGNGQLTGKLHQHYGDAIKHNAAIGRTHWQSSGLPADLAGPKPVVFFAPSWFEHCLKELGAKELNTRIGKAWFTFTQQAKNWLNIHQESGIELVQARYETMLAGNVDPKSGHILSIS